MIMLLPGLLIDDLYEFEKKTIWSLESGFVGISRFQLVRLLTRSYHDLQMMIIMNPCRRNITETLKHAFNIQNPDSIPVTSVRTLHCLIITAESPLKI